MKILFDTNTPAALAHFLKGHTVIRAAQKGWQGSQTVFYLTLPRMQASTYC